MDLAEAGPLRPLLLPAVQHQLVEVGGAVDRSRQSEAVLDGLDHLDRWGEREQGNGQVDREVNVENTSRFVLARVSHR